MKMRTLTCWGLVAGFAVGLAVWLAPKIALASVEDQHCCNPAHIEDPPAPAGSASDCYYDTMNNMCKSRDNKCAGVAWRTAVPGKCCTPLVGGNTCNNSNGTTVVIIAPGTWGCSGASASDCSCKWSLNLAGRENVQVSQCSGSTCGSNPVCN